MGLEDFAKRELAGALARTEDDPGARWTRRVALDTLDLIHLFCEQGHSGASAPTVAGYFTKLAMYEPLSPLTGADDEWMDISEEMGAPMWQNRRYHSVFKRASGIVEDIQHYEFRLSSGLSFCCGASCEAVTFPYTPTRITIPLLFDEEEPKDALRRYKAAQAAHAQFEERISKLEVENAQLVAALRVFYTHTMTVVSKEDFDHMLQDDTVHETLKMVVRLCRRLFDTTTRAA